MALIFCFNKLEERFMGRKSSIKLGIAALAVYIFGGIGVFGGIWLIVFRRGVDLMGLGEGHTIGYLLLCVGAALSIIGVLLMRLFRNRGIA
jgi:ABC-type Fe3+-siderophore transport system permease subunit